MDERLDEEISFLEKSCERLHLQIERQSTSISVNRPMRDSGMATMTTSAESKHAYLEKGQMIQ
jgi:hypothetical protein